VVYEQRVHSAHEPFRRALEEALGEPITRDGLTGAWSLLQRKRGHRHSTDDVLTAAYALEHGGAPEDATALDLGAGIGTVGLLVLWGLGERARLVGVEAQEVSFRLFRENVAMNGLEARVSPVHGDLRTTALSQRFPLITGSPPYFDVRAGVVPADSQKAHARFELRGTVADYALAAERALTADGRFVFCFPTAQKARALDGVRAADEGAALGADAEREQAHRHQEEGDRQQRLDAPPRRQPQIPRDDGGEDRAHCTR